MAARKSTKTAKLRPKRLHMYDVFDIRLMKEIGFPLAFPIMPLGAFCWASAPWRFDPDSTYEIEDGKKIIRVGTGGTRFNFATLSDEMDHHCFLIESESPCRDAIKGVFVGSKKAIEHFKGVENRNQILRDLIDESTTEAIDAVAKVEKLVTFA